MLTLNQNDMSQDTNDDKNQIITFTPSGYYQSTPYKYSGTWTFSGGRDKFLKMKWKLYGQNEWFDENTFVRIGVYYTTVRLTVDNIGQGVTATYKISTSNVIATNNIVMPIYIYLYEV